MCIIQINAFPAEVSLYILKINNLDHKNLTHASRTPDLDKDNTNFTQKEHNMLF